MTIRNHQVSISILDRKKHFVRHLIGDHAWQQFEYETTESLPGDGKIVFHTKHIGTDVVRDLISGTSIVYINRVWRGGDGQIKADNYYGLVLKCILRSGRGTATYNVLLTHNEIIAAGQSTTGTARGRSAVRRGDPANQVSNGMHEYLLDASNCKDRDCLLASADAELQKQLKQRNSGKADWSNLPDDTIIEVYMADAKYYTSMRVADTHRRDNVFYGGNSAGEYIYNFCYREMVQPINRDTDYRKVDANIRVVNRSIGPRFGRSVTWERLDNVIAKCCEDTGIVFEYRLDTNAKTLVFDTRPRRDRRFGEDEIRLSTKSLPIDHDILPGDIVHYTPYLSTSPVPYIDDAFVIVDTIKVSQKAGEQIKIEWEHGEKEKNMSEWIDLIMDRNHNSRAAR